MGKPIIPNLNPLITLGIDPKTGAPLKATGPNKCTLKDDIKRALRVMDEQNAIERFEWHNLPDGLDGEMIERILYYRGTGAFMYMEADNKFYFLPYALHGPIDVYGRTTEVTPLPFNGTTNMDDKKPWIPGLVKKPMYGIKLPEDLVWDDITDSCVIVNDYSKQLSQTVIPRQQLNDSILDVEAEMIPYMRTSCMLGTGVKGMKVGSQDEAQQVDWAGDALHKAALTGQGYVPIVGTVDFQELTDGANLKGADYMQALESIDNFRLSLFGIDNGGVFQKKAHMLETEQAMAGGAIGMVLQNSLSARQKACDIANSLWNLGIWVTPKESTMGGDMNRDGLGYDIDDSQGIDMGGEEDDTNV